MSAILLAVVPGLLAAAIAGAAPASAAPSYPAPDAFLVDAAHLLPDASTQQIEGELASFHDRTQHQLAVVTVPDLGGQDVEDYARSLFDRWGIGRAGVDDGGLLLLAVRERQVRIQVGDGLRALGLSDDRAVDIVNEITPALHRNDFAGGLLAGERSIRRAVGDSALEQRATDPVVRFEGGRAIAADAGHTSTKPWLVVLTLTLFGALIGGLTFMVVRSMRGSGGPGAGGPSAGGYIGGIAGASVGGAGGAVGGGGGATGGF